MLQVMYCVTWNMDGMLYKIILLLKLLKLLSVCVYVVMLETIFYLTLRLLLKYN